MKQVKPHIVIKEIISKALKCDKRRIFVKSCLVNDLGADSMKILEIIIAVERELKIEIDDERIDAVLDELKVKDLVDAANNAVKEKHMHDARLMFRKIYASNLLENCHSVK